MAAALTYSGTAAIHACLLVWRGPSYGELDLYALTAILSTSCLVIVPLINWSTTLRHLGSRDGRETGARSIIIYWGALVALALVSALIGLWSNNSSSFQYSTLNNTICSPPSSQMNNVAGQDSSWHHFHVDAEWVQENRCIDPCQQQNLFYWPVALFRSYSDLQILSQEDIRNIYGLIEQMFVGFYAYFGTSVATFLLLQGIWAACFGRRKPRQCRYIIYVFLSNVNWRLGWQGIKMGYRGDKHWQKRTAKTIAAVAYLWTVFATLLSVLFFIFNIVAMEAFLAEFPQGESAVHIGAWGPWVTTALVLLAGLVAQFHPLLVLSISISLRKCWSRRWTYFERRQASRKNHQGENKAARTGVKSRLLVPPTQSDSRHSRWVFAPFGSFSKRIMSCVGDIKEEWVLLKAFWRDPDRTVEDEG